MAARRLKFKAKPSVVNSVRRARDKEDIPGLSQIERSVTDNESPMTNQEGPNSECKEDNLYSCPGSDNNEILTLNKTTTKDIVVVTSNLGELGTATTFSDPLTNESCKGEDSQNCSSENSTSLNIELLQQNRVPSNSESLTNHSFDEYNCSSKSISQGKESCTLLSKNISNLIIDSISDSSDISCDKVSTLTDEGSLRSAPDSINNNIESISSSAKESPCDKSNRKSDSTKIISRFGRSRCKPVLNNARKKNEVSGNLDCSSVNNVRTDSVIRSVQSELSKINSMAKENDNNGNSSELQKPVNSNFKDETVIPSKSVGESDDITAIEKNQSKISPVVNNFLETTIVNEPKNNRNETSLERLSSIDLKCKNHKMPSSNESRAELSNSASNPITPCKLLLSPLRPSPKVLVPKPSPRLTDAASRRISFHGSDSEEEAKRKFSILKEKPSIPQTVGKEKILKNSKRKRSQGATFTKLGQDTMKELTKKLNGSEGSPDKTKLTMLDLIFYNPKSNPMSMNPNQNSTARKKEEKNGVSEAVEEMLEEQSVDDVDSTSGVMPVPQLKVGPDGQIMLDPHSLVIETTGMQKSREKLENSQIVEENGITRYSTYSKRKFKRTDWTATETLQFYRALSTIGSDFSLMAHLFPKRSRHELKLKFKREERTNMQLVDKAMSIRSDFDFQTLEEELKQENKEIEKKAREKELAKEAARKERALRKTKSGTVAAHWKTLKNKNIKYRDSAFKEFYQDEREQLFESNPKKTLKKKTRTRKQIKTVIESDSEQDELLYSDSSDEGNGCYINLKERMKSFCRRGKKITKTLKECEEINETLKKELEHENTSRMKMEKKLVNHLKNLDREAESEDDVYTPNGTNAFMLFSSPSNRPAKTPEEEPSHAEDMEDCNWNIEIQELPNLEETVVVDNVEEVSELSELGSFGQNDTALDLSVPVRANITSDMLKDRHSLLNRHLISESIQIIDQLTSVESTSSSVFTEVKDNIGDELSVEELDDNQIRLPSFESVNRSRPSYPLQAPYDPRNYERSASEVVIESHNKETRDNSELSDVFIANFYREIDDEYIVGD